MRDADIIQGIQEIKQEILNRDDNMKLKNLTDISISAPPPVNNEMLTYEESSEQWRNKPIEELLPDLVSAISVYMGSNQIINSDTETLIAFDTENYDLNTEYDNTAGNYKFTAKIAGYYSIKAQIVFDFDSDGKIAIIRIKQDGTIIANGITVTSHHVYQHIVGVSKDIYMAVGDEIQFYFYHVTGVAKPIIAGNLNSYVTIHKISG